MAQKRVEIHRLQDSKLDKTIDLIVFSPDYQRWRDEQRAKAYEARNKVYNYYCKQTRRAEKEKEYYWKTREDRLAYWREYARVKRLAKEGGSMKKLKGSNLNKYPMAEMDKQETKYQGAKADLIQAGGVRPTDQLIDQDACRASKGFIPRSRESAK